MTNLSSSSPTRLQENNIVRTKRELLPYSNIKLLALLEEYMILKPSFIFSVFFAFAGFLDAVYLTIIHYKNLIPPCSIAHGCETVLTSRYATVGPVPIALIGSVFYLGILALLFLFLQTKSRRVITLVFSLCIGCLVVAAGLVYLQAAVIHAYCQYCLASEAVDVLLLISVWKLWKLAPQES